MSSRVFLVIIVSHDRYFMDKVVDHLLIFKGDGIIQDFPGNYTQYREWMKALPRPSQPNENRSDPQVSSPKMKAGGDSSSKRKLSYKEKREMEQLEIDIESLETEKKQLEEALCSGTLSIDELTEKSKRLPKLQEELDEKSMRWLELSDI